MRHPISTIAALLALSTTPIFNSGETAAVDLERQYGPAGRFQVAMIEVAPAALPVEQPSDESETTTASGEADSAKRDPIAERMARLTKPLGQIRLEPVSDGSKSPEDKAAAQLSGEVTVITAEFLPFAPFDRYPICSCHNPLYFEEPDLERCGNGCGIATTAVSALHFLANTVTLPYQVAADPPCKTHCALGDCRCCEQMPRMRPFECKLHAATLQGLATAGFVFLLL
ncbi:hypothetical protein Poly24_45530 [Rosistilla carotiformis]|uniref:Uncharacterized protein n=1 Tax=Rosistilla carotiformis TaxID=2528017 RepID=A0A518JZ48_9BACT|nr:hypothetical protein [Rosistilla carotiformis]QDV70820.1 hypothetical protein Poly24_45530 [Rosistilla carotiformis]